MKHIVKKSLSMLMALLMIVSLFAGISIRTDAATVDYQYGYVSSKYPSVIKNWGTREVEATFLSPNAIAFYQDQGTSYNALAAKAGSSDLDKVSSSALYLALNALMANAQNKTTSYDDTRAMYQFTDCQENGDTTEAISAFYSGTAVGPAWDSGKTWNREHVWPNSKGGDGDSGANETDIMMLRPETSSNNSSRGNKAFGLQTTSQYYYPNLTSTYDVRGDVARIVLYTYVRWGVEKPVVIANMWGASGVIQSKEVLLTWMEEDPVDTWEMGRNDSVQSITGTRNVFVDYPELAFELFDEPVPEDMVTPSGNAAGGCKHDEAATEIAPTLTQWGYTQLYCSKCNEQLGVEDRIKPLTSVESWSLTLGEDVSVNFRVDVRASIKNTAKIHLTTVSGTQIISVSELTPVEGDIYHISVKLAAMQMVDGVSVKIVNGEDSTGVKTYYIKDYANTILNGSYTEETKSMVKAMLHYGAAAQTYFGYKADTLVNAGVDGMTAAVPAVSKAPSYTGSVEGVTYTGATLVLRDKIAVRYYFDVDGELSQYTFTKDGVAYTPEKKGDSYYIEVADINPQDLDNSYTVKVNDSLTVVYSPMNYIVNMYNSGGESLRALMQATYAYYQAAEALTAN